jgi:hypothetical protein
MKAILALIPILLLASCANTAFIGHRTGYDINTEVKPDLSSPVSMNAGFESHSGVAAPPEKSLPPKYLRRTENLPNGQVLPTISRLSIERNIAGATGAEVEYVTLTATGQAAVNTTDPRKMASISEDAAQNETNPSLLTQIATEPLKSR